MAITRIADLPIRQREPLDLLALTVERLCVDRDWAGFGWAWVEPLELAAPGRPSIVLPRALVLALHSADEQVDADDVELELDVDGEVVRAPLSKVLAVHLPLMPTAPELVLALCNPAEVAVRRPALATGRIHWARGDVTSWLDRDADGGEHIRLAAREWNVS